MNKQEEVKQMIGRFNWSEISIITGLPIDEVKQIAKRKLHPRLYELAEMTFNLPPIAAPVN